MMRFKKFLIVCVLFSLLAFGNYAYTGYAAKKLEIEKIEPELKNLASSQKVKVIVWVERKEIQKLAKIGRIRHEYYIIPAVAMEVDSSRLSELAMLDNVKKIVKSKEIHALRLESIPLIRADLASSNFSVNGTRINISIVDTGIYNHSEFQNPNRIIKQKCYCNVYPGNCCPDGNPESDNATDDYWHGTHCAGIAAGKGDGYGFGVATNASLFAVKVLNASGSGTEDDVIAGIDWAVGNGANIISLSLGGPVSTDCYEYSLSEAVDNATKQGVVVVVAAGNEGGSGNETIAAPGCAKRAITVGASNDTDDIASFSSRGPTTDNRTKPDLVAPGVNITSTTNGLTSYGSAPGTSQATPHVAGIAALMIQKFNKNFGYFPEPDRVKAILLTAVNTSGMNSAGYQQRNNVFGAGRIDAYEALRIINFTRNGTITEGETHTFRINVSSNNAKVTLYWPEDKLTNNNLDLTFGNSTHNFSYPTDFNDSIEQVFVYDANPGWWKVFVKASNVSGSQVYYLASNFEISSLPPSINVQSPENKTYTTGNIHFNFSVDIALTNAFFSVDGMDNQTMANDTVYHYYNVTYPSLSEGFHNVTFYANSTEGLSSSTVYFSIDTIPPSISVISPLANVNYSIREVWFNFSTNEACDSGIFSLDGNQNKTMNKLNETYFFNLTSLNEGFHNVTFYANDTAGLWNRSQVNFSVMILPNISSSNVDKPLLLINETVNITAIVIDENLNFTLINITWPSNASKIYIMQNDSSLFFYQFNSTNETGIYTAMIMANDTFGNENNASVMFETSWPVNFSSSVSNGTTPVNVSVAILYNSSSQVRNQTTNTSFEFIIPAGIWDFILNTTILNISLKGANFTENLTREIKLNDDVRMNYLSTNVRAIKTVAIKFENFTFASANLTFEFNSSLVNNRSRLEVYRCGEWDFSNSDCESNWQEDSSDNTFNASIDENNVSLVTLNFSSFSLAENETVTTTTVPTTTIVTTTVSGGASEQTTTTEITTSTTTTEITTTTSTITTTVQETTTTVPIEVSEKRESHWPLTLAILIIVVILLVVYRLKFKSLKEDKAFEELKKKWSQKYEL